MGFANDIDLFSDNLRDATLGNIAVVHSEVDLEVENYTYIGHEIPISRHNKTYELKRTIAVSWGI